MLISHRKQFIFTKTVKTAGTSVESYFEQYCMPEGEWRESHARDEYVSEAGIVGLRAADTSGATWFNHMPARRIRDLIGRDTWNRYFKFTVVRNPFDKMISAFFMWDGEAHTSSDPQPLAALAKRESSEGDPIGRAGGDPESERFRDWVRTGQWSRTASAIIDRDKYLIDGEESVDCFIRFEDLHEGMRHVCDRLAIPFDPSRVPEFKKGMRHHRIPIRDYYDRETEMIVRKLYAWEFERFGYELPV